MPDETDAAATSIRVPPSLEQLLQGRDEDYEPHRWEETKEIIASGNIALLGRWPSDARRYVAWAEETRKQHGSVTNFLCDVRLGWTPLAEGDARRKPGSVFAYESATPFACESDFKILRNDWPYRWDADIVHICVWLKNRLPVDEQKDGSLTPEGNRIVEQFVEQNFTSALGQDGKDRVLWFKNYTANQSVAALEHFHVLIRGAPDWLITKVLDEDNVEHEKNRRSIS